MQSLRELFSSKSKPKPEGKFQLEPTEHNEKIVGTSEWGDVQLIKNSDKYAIYMTQESEGERYVLHVYNYETEAFVKPLRFKNHRDYAHVINKQLHYQFVADNQIAVIIDDRVIHINLDTGRKLTTTISPQKDNIKYLLRLMPRSCYYFVPDSSKEEFCQQIVILQYHKIKLDQYVYSVVESGIIQLRLGERVEKMREMRFEHERLCSELYSQFFLYKNDGILLLIDQDIYLATIVGDKIQLASKPFLTIENTDTTRLFPSPDGQRVIISSKNTTGSLLPGYRLRPSYTFLQYSADADTWLLTAFPSVLKDNLFFAWCGTEHFVIQKVKKEDKYRGTDVQYQVCHFDNKITKVAAVDNRLLPGERDKISEDGWWLKINLANNELSASELVAKDKKRDQFLQAALSPFFYEDINRLIRSYAEIPHLRMFPPAPKTKESDAKKGPDNKSSTPSVSPPSAPPVAGKS